MQTGLLDLARKSTAKAMFEATNDTQTSQDLQRALLDDHENTLSKEFTEPASCVDIAGNDSDRDPSASVFFDFLRSDPECWNVKKFGECKMKFCKWCPEKPDPSPKAAASTLSALRATLNLKLELMPPQIPTLMLRRGVLMIPLMLIGTIMINSHIDLFSSTLLYNMLCALL